MAKTLDLSLALANDVNNNIENSSKTVVSNNKKSNGLPKTCSKCNTKGQVVLLNNSSSSKRLELMPSASEMRSIEKFSRSPYLNSVTDLREELLKTKRVYAVTLRENSLIRTKLKIAEKECRRREEEIEDILTNKTEKSSEYEKRFQLSVMRKKILQFERSLREKNEENAQLMMDRSAAKAAETRKLLVKVQNECDHLRSHLSQSIPESEFLREKHQYMQIIDKLTEENMGLRKIIGEYEKRRKEFQLSDASKALERIYGRGNLIKEFRKSSITTRRKADFYKNALLSLVQNRNLPKALKPRSNSESGAVPTKRGAYGISKKAHKKPVLISSVSTGDLLPSILSGTNPSQRSFKANKHSLLKDHHCRTNASLPNYSKSSDSEHSRVVWRNNGRNNKSFSPSTNDQLRSMTKMYPSISSDELIGDDDDEMEDIKESSDQSTLTDDSTHLVNYQKNENDGVADVHNNLELMLNGGGTKFNGEHSASTSLTNSSSNNTRRRFTRPPTNFSHVENAENTTPNSDNLDGEGFTANLEALKLEYSDEIGIGEVKMEHNLDNIIKSVQSHILRVKMCQIREQTLMTQRKVLRSD